MQLQHLLRRAGFGASQQELDKFTAMGLPATVEYLIEYYGVEDPALENRLSPLNLDLTRLGDLQRWWLLRMIYTQRPLQEKMVLFWHGLLTSGFSKVGSGQSMYSQNQLFREKALSHFDDILKAISRDPAMLIWLDSRSNRKAAPNENFARELMELFSMGIGNYTETDVRESARAFTGWGLDKTGFVFSPAQHDTGPKTFLGRTGNFDGYDIVDIIMQQPVTATFISRKIFEFFAYDNPDPETVASLATTFTRTSFSIKAVVRQILTSPEFYSEKAYRAKVKSPAELVASTLRSLAIETDGRFLGGLTDRMGQSLFNPFDVSGWPGGAAWINSTTLLERLSFANKIATDRGRTFPFSPHAVLTQRQITSGEDAADYYTALLLDGNLPPEEQSILVTYLRALPALSPGTPTAATDERLRSLVYLVLSSPDYQLA